MMNELPTDLQAFVRSEIDQQHYASENELLVDAVRHLQLEREAAVAGIQRGLASLEKDEGIPINEAFRRLEEKYMPTDQQ